MNERFEPQHNRILIAFAIIVSFIAILFISFSMCSEAKEKYILKSDEEILLASEVLVKSQVGIEEEKGNRGGNVEDYLSSVGINFPAPYCMAGQYWAFYTASKIINKDIPIKRTAGAVAQFNFFKARGKKVDYVPAVHDFIVWQKSGSWTGHIERIIDIGEKGWVTTIGFNTGNGNQRDGEGNYIRKRHLYNPISMLLVKGLAGYEIK